MNIKPKTLSERLAVAEYGRPGERSSLDVMRRWARESASLERCRDQWAERFMAALRSGFILAGAAQAVCTAPGDEWRDASRVRPCGAVTGREPGLSRGVPEFLAADGSGEPNVRRHTVLSCEHPDIDAFIQRRPGEERSQDRRLAGLTDAFMAAVDADRDWQLVHAAEPGATLKLMGAFQDTSGRWVYRTVRARNLLERITQAGQAGVIDGLLFMDRFSAQRAEGLDAIVPYASCGPPVRAGVEKPSLIDSDALARATRRKSLQSWLAVND